MADITLAEFKERFTEFAEIDGAVISPLIPQAYEHSDVGYEPTLYCLAHLVSLCGEANGQPDRGSGVVVKQGVGPHTVEFATQAKPGERSAFFATSTYGRRMLALEDTTASAMIGVVVA